MEDQCDKEYVAGESIVKLLFSLLFGKIFLIDSGLLEETIFLFQKPFFLVLLFFLTKKVAKKSRKSASWRTAVFSDHAQE